MKRILTISLLLLAVIFTVSADRRRLLGQRNVASAAAVTATDTFNRTDDSPMSTAASDGTSIWKSGPNTLFDCNIVGNQLGGSTTGSGATVTNKVFSANQKVTLTIGSAGAGNGIGQLLRIKSDADMDGYLVYMETTGDMQLYTINDTGTLALTLVVSWPMGRAFANGDTWRCEFSGSTLSVFTNNVLRISTNNTTYSHGGLTGVYMQNTKYIDTFDASDL
jgi:hypothetical protein